MSIQALSYTKKKSFLAFLAPLVVFILQKIIFSLFQFLSRSSLPSLSQLYIPPSDIQRSCGSFSKSTLLCKRCDGAGAGVKVLTA